ncbi:MAG: XdhC/CoxI family protein [Anaerolineaceae bacterium]|nr:XdhC/CoxI family protein [Anaerolineaceae bacterium]
MKDIILELDSWISEGQDVVLATVVDTWGSAPRGVGAKMALTANGKMCGSVSGGCVEGAIVEAAKQVFNTGQSSLLEFGVTDDTAWEVGLACGGTISVFVQLLNEDVFRAIRASDNENLVTITVIGGSKNILGRQMVVTENGDQTGSINSNLDNDALSVARYSLQQGASKTVKLQNSIELFVEVVSAPLTLILIGGVHIAIPLSEIAKMIGYRTIVIDPRRSFGSEDRFPHVDLLLQSWPDSALDELELNSSTAVAVLTHDPKIDDIALVKALPSQAFYVGALGSQTTNASRLKRLFEAGLKQKDIDRLSAPIGLDIGGRSPQEIALAIMAEITTIYYRKN